VIELAKQIRKKDKKAVALLYERYGRKLYGFAVHKWRVEEDEAWELVYKTLYKIISVMDKYTFETESKFNGFIYQVFINYLRNHYNETKYKKPETISFEERIGGELTEKKEESPDNVYMRCLKKILEQFDDWKRVLLLMKAQNFTYEEISKYVNKPVEHLKVYYGRAKESLTEKVNECVDGKN
jgi:RNA polymerase sigma factor (sigma-70 family)